jgi:hypothetical protein
MSEDRDYVAEMDALIEGATQGSDWVPAIVAAKILASADADLVSGWLHSMAADLLTSVITKRERSTRSVARARAGSRAFAEARAASEAETRVASETGEPATTPGAPIALGSFAVTYAVDDKNTRRRVADMRGKDHLFVAADYEKDAKPLLLLAAFHQAVAKKVGRKRTCDVFSEAAYDRLYRSVTRAPEEAVA